MLGEIRVALIYMGIAAASIPQIVGNPFPKDSPTLENEYVRVTAIPRLTHPPTVLATCGSSDDQPIVLIYVPTDESSRAPTSTLRSQKSAIAAKFYGPHNLFQCPAWQGGSGIWIDLKSVPLVSVLNDDAVKLDAAHNDVLLDNERVRVVRIHFDPAESGPIVDKRPRVILAVTDSHAAVTFPDGHSEPRDMKAGAVSFGNAGRQATKNTGTTPLENIVVELKSKDSEKK